jgi:hypothetical protein
VHVYDSTRIAITANSLIRIDVEKFVDCYLVLDEFSKLLPYLKAPILNGKRADIYNILCEIIRNAKKIIILDADLRPEDLEIVLKIKNTKSYYLYKNNFQNRLGINAYFYTNALSVVNKLMDDFKNKIPKLIHCIFLIFVLYCKMFKYQQTK